MRINLGGITFKGPFSAGWWIAPPAGGVYAVLAHDANWRPLPYRLLHVGQAERFADGDFPAGHDEITAWICAAGSESKLYLATHSMPASSEAQRSRIAGELITQYRPECNTAASVARARARGSAGEHRTEEEHAFF